MDKKNDQSQTVAMSTWDELLMTNVLCAVIMHVSATCKHDASGRCSRPYAADFASGHDLTIILSLNRTGFRCTKLCSCFLKVDGRSEYANNHLYWINCS